MLKLDREGEDFVFENEHKHQLFFVRKPQTVVFSHLHRVVPIQTLAVVQIVQGDTEIIFSCVYADKLLVALDEN